MSKSNQFDKLFSDPPASCRGIDIIHQVRNRRGFREIWHHLPKDPDRTLNSFGSKKVDQISYGPHQELDPDLGIRGDLRCILGVGLPYIQLNQDLDELVAGGIGGLAGNVAWSADYPFDAQDWRDFRGALDYCREHGLEMWFYDEAGYPSGHANQRVFDGHPEFVAQGLCWSSASCSGPGSCTLALPQGTLFAVVAVAEEDGKLDGLRQRTLAAEVRGGNLEVSVPEGSWHVFAFADGEVWDGTHADHLNIRYPNLLDGSAVRRFIDVTHEVYFREAGDYFGDTLTGVFTDEPSLMAPIVPAFKDGKAYPNLPWVYDLPDVFQARTGYPLAEALPALVAEVGAPTIQRRCDFWGTITELISTRCYRQIGDWCRSHGIAYTGHLLWEERIGHHVRLQGDMMECLRYFGWPGYDALRAITRDDDPDGFAMRTLGAKYVTSAAHLYGKPHTMCETFGVTDPQPLEVFKHVLDVLVLLGLEKHGYYSIHDILSAEQRRLLNTHLGRISLAGFYGCHRCEVAILYPIVAAQAAYDPNKPLEYQPVDELDHALRLLSEGVLDAQMDFDFCDDASLQQGCVDNIRWQAGQESYRVILVPPMAVMRRATLQALACAAKGGVAVVFADRYPEATAEEGQNASLAQWCGDRFGKPIPAANAGEFIRGLDVESANLTPASDAVWITRRQATSPDAEWTDIFLIVNTRKAPYAGEIELPVTGVPYVCDVDTGAVHEAKPVAADKHGNTVSLNLKGCGVAILAVAGTLSAGC